MSPLREALADYLTVRRALGFKLDHAGRYLAQFVAYLEARNAHTVTVEHALAWATRPSCGAAWQGLRLAMVRGFAVHLRSVDPATEVPPARMISPGLRRARPYLYTDADIRALVGAATVLPFPLQVATYQTLIGLLAWAKPSRWTAPTWTPAWACSPSATRSTASAASCRCIPAQPPPWPAT